MPACIRGQRVSFKGFDIGVADIAAVKKVTPAQAADDIVTARSVENVVASSGVHCFTSFIYYGKHSLINAQFGSVLPV